VSGPPKNSTSVAATALLGCSRFSGYTVAVMSDDGRDLATQSYADLWVPRLIPYYDDFVQKTAPRPGERVLVTSVGCAAHLRAVSHAMEEQGVLVATDSSPTMIEMARESLASMDIRMPVQLQATEAGDTLDRQWDLILDAFGLWHLPDRGHALRQWRNALAHDGQLGVLVWGPPDPEGPFEKLAIALRITEPTIGELAKAWHLAERQPMRDLLHQAGFKLVRHATVRHTMEFASAEGFFAAVVKGWISMRGWNRLGAQRTARVAEAFFSLLDPPSPSSPLVFAPSATIAIADPA